MVKAWVKIFPRSSLRQVESMQIEALPYIIIASVLKMVKEYTDPQTGRTELLMQIKDEDGFDIEPIRLGKQLTEATDRIDLNEVEILMQEVNKRLVNEFQHVDKQKELKKKVSAKVDEIKQERSGNLNDPIYKSFNEAGRVAVNLINGIN